MYLYFWYQESEVVSGIGTNYQICGFMTRMTTQQAAVKKL